MEKSLSERLLGWWVFFKEIVTSIWSFILFICGGLGLLYNVALAPVYTRIDKAEARATSISEGINSRVTHLKELRDLELTQMKTDIGEIKENVKWLVRHEKNKSDK